MVSVSMCNEIEAVKGYFFNVQRIVDQQPIRMRRAALRSMGRNHHHPVQFASSLSRIVSACWNQGVKLDKKPLAALSLSALQSDISLNPASEPQTSKKSVSVRASASSGEVSDPNVPAVEPVESSRTSDYWMETPTDWIRLHVMMMTALCRPKARGREHAVRDIKRCRHHINFHCSCSFFNMSNL